MSILDRQSLVYDLRVRENARNAWFIIRVHPQKHDAFLTIVQSSDAFDLRDYGIILASGWGEPDPTLQEELKRKGILYTDKA